MLYLDQRLDESNLTRIVARIKAGCIISVVLHYNLWYKTISLTLAWIGLFVRN